MEILIVGHLYIIDFEHMHQYRLNDTQRRRRIKYDLISAPKKGVAGLKLDLQRLDSSTRNSLFEQQFFFYRQTERNPEVLEAPVVPSLASSVASVIANSSSPDRPAVVSRSRSNADGEEPASSPLPPPARPITPVLVPTSETNRTGVRQPADGLGNPSTTNPTSWRTSQRHDERHLISWSDNDEEDDDDEVPPASRLRPVLIGGEDNPQFHHSDGDNDDDNDNTILTNLSLNNPN